MVFYFSGTGNSLWVAKQLSEAFNEPLISIAEAIKAKEGTNDGFHFEVSAEESLFFVFPVHSWGPAVLVDRFISRLRLDGYTRQPIYSVCTCGDECGYTDKKIKRLLAKQGYSLTGSYSIQMPNNYILLPGFDVDAPEVEKQKLKDAVPALNNILRTIKTNAETPLYETGSLPFLKSDIIYPLFAGLAIKRNSFYATDACISCGLCVRVCPTETISMERGARPEWKKNSCVQCVACIHQCPTRAIEYGTISKKKGRYCHPSLLKKSK